MTDETGKKIHQQKKSTRKEKIIILEKKKTREVKVYSPSQKLDDYYLFA